MERLRHLARAGAVEHRVLVRESVPALAALVRDSGALVLSSRRLLQHHPGSGPLAWLCARILCGEDPRSEAWRCAGEIDDDATAEHLASELPEVARVVVLGWPEVSVAALARRGDVSSLIVDVKGVDARGGEGAELAYQLQGIDLDAAEVAEAGMAAAVRSADPVVLEAATLGPDAFVAVSGSYAAAAVARYAGVPVWLVAGVGRALPPGLWAGMARRLERPEPWMSTDEIVPLDLVDVVVRPTGRMSGAVPPDCPDAPELR
ncbi:hypothetical protein BH23ACT1_BH23ACT1_02250 [soil metagenome]